MAEHKLSICMGTACSVKGADKLYNYAIENKPDNFEIIKHRCDGRCGLAPVVIFDDTVVYGRCTTDIIQELYDEHGTSGSGDITDIDKDEYHKIATISSVNNICKGQFFVSEKEVNRCPTKKELDFATNNNIGHQAGVVLNNHNTYADIQLIKLDDLNKRTVLPLSYYIKNQQSIKIDHDIILRCYFSTDGTNFLEFDSIWLASELRSGGLLNDVWYVDLTKIPNFDPGKKQYYIQFFCEGTKYKQDWTVSHTAYNGDTYKENLYEETTNDRYNKWSGIFVLQPRSQNEAMSYFTCKDRQGYVMYGIAWIVN